jgi:hypothetical protein
VFEKKSAASTGGGDGQILRWVIGQFVLLLGYARRKLSIGSAGSASQAAGAA